MVEELCRLGVNTFAIAPGIAPSSCVTAVAVYVYFYNTVSANVQNGAQFCERVPEVSASICH